MKLDLSDISFRELTPAVQDLDDYERLILAGMSEDDALARSEFGIRLIEGRLRAWWAEHDGRIAGWCALAPHHGKYFPNAAHLYGAWVRPDARRQGLAALMFRYRLDRIPPGTPVTVSIQRGKDGSLALAMRYGFTELGPSGPWMNYLKQPSGQNG